MFRTARRIAPLLSSLLFGAATVTAVVATTGTIAGCADENDPKTHVKRLSDPATRVASVNRLVQFFEDAMSRDKGDRNGATVKPLLDTIIEPMSQACLAGDMDERTYAKLVKFVSDARDPRGGDCLTKVLKDFKPGSKETEEPARAAARAVGAMKLKSASGPLLEAFLKLRVSQLQKEPELYRDVADALIQNADPAWEAQLLERLTHPIPDAKDKKNIDTVRDEVYWQTTSAQVLGLTKSANAVKPLLKILLAPSKGNVGATAVNALIKIGKPAVAPTIALLKSEDKDLVDFSKGEYLKANAEDGKLTDAVKKASETAHLPTAAIVLSSIGREEAAAALMGAIDSGDDLTRAVIARELPKLPKSDDTVKAFQAAVDKTPTSLSIPGAGGAREALLESAGYFFDASFVPWIVKSALELKGSADDTDPIKAAALQSAMKLMTVDQIPEVQKLYDASIKGPDGKPAPLGKAYEREWKLVTDLLNSCKGDAGCYLTKAVDPASQAKEGQFAGIKAMYMVGILGGADVRPKLVDALATKVPNAALRFVASQIIDRYSPKGDAALATAIQKIIDDAEATKDGNKIAGNAPLKTVAYRLAARAQ